MGNEELLHRFLDGATLEFVALHDWRQDEETVLDRFGRTLRLVGLELIGIGELATLRLLEPLANCIDVVLVISHVFLSISLGDCPPT
jgi:hypothetical protein